MTTDVTEIINAISNALGIVYNKAVDLYPSVVKMNIAFYIFSFLGGIIFCALAYWFLCGYYKRIANRFKKEHHTDFNYWDYIDMNLYGGLALFGVICAIIGVPVCFLSAYHLITWIVAPDIMSIQWVVNLMK